MKQRNLTQKELNQFQFLNDLRNSGVTNMFGATPYIQNEFGIDKNEASSVLILWMNNFNEDAEAYKDLLI